MKHTQGFTLIELAIVLVIMTILIGGLAVPLSAQIQARRIAENSKIMEEAREAIIGYAMTHPATPANSRHLPCPDIDGDGVEDRDGDDDACMPVAGVIAPTGLLPWVDLGVASQDAWGNRLRYAVVADLASRTAGFSIAGATPPNPLVACSTNACAVAAPDVADNLALVLVSHGPNGWGAQNINNPPGTLLAAPTGPDEAANLDTDRIYVSRAPTRPDAAAGEFDDRLSWISLSQLIARVCPTGCSP